MTRQIALGYGAPSRADLENRIHALEVKVISLTKAVTLLAQALENGPPAGAGDAAGEGRGDDEAAAKAARQVHELLLAPLHVDTTESGQ
jgi:hypothetical protein